MPPIQPRTLKGFRDYLPETMLPRERIIDTARRVFRSYGFSPIDTPALEYLEILLGKGGAETDKQLYRFQDHGGRDVGMRFDLTVPLARFAAQHIGELGTPFKRYHIATVWRGENTQRGRYREFMQCDFDTIGTKSVAADAETVLVIHDLLRAIGFERFTIHVNNRLVLTGLLESLGLEAQATDVLRALDKLAKIGAEQRRRGNRNKRPAHRPTDARRIVELAQLTGANDADPRRSCDRSSPAASAARRASIDSPSCCRPSQPPAFPAERVRLDLSIARGLDYYTGTVLETTLDDLPDDRQRLQRRPLRQSGRALHEASSCPASAHRSASTACSPPWKSSACSTTAHTPAQVFIPYFDAARLGDYFHLAAELRAAGLAVEVYPEPTKLGKQLQYADRKGFRVAVIAGEREFAAGECQIKNLANHREHHRSAGRALVAEIKRILAK